MPGIIQPIGGGNGMIRNVSAANAQTQPIPQGLIQGQQPTGMIRNVTPGAVGGAQQPMQQAPQAGAFPKVTPISPPQQQMQQQQQGMFGIQQLMQLLQGMGGYGGYGGYQQQYQQPQYQQGPQQPQWASGYQRGYGMPQQQPMQSLMGGMNTAQYRQPMPYGQGYGMPFGMGMPYQQQQMTFNPMAGMYGNSRSQFGWY